MKEQTYVKLLDNFTYTVVAVIIIYIILFVIEYYNKPMIDMNKTTDCIHNKITDNDDLFASKDE